MSKGYGKAQLRVLEELSLYQDDSSLWMDMSALKTYTDSAQPHIHRILKGFIKSGMVQERTVLDDGNLLDQIRSKKEYTLTTRVLEANAYEQRILEERLEARGLDEQEKISLMGKYRITEEQYNTAHFGSKFNQCSIEEMIVNNRGNK